MALPLVSLAAWPDWLPATGEVDPAVPTPAEVLGFHPGERHVRSHEILRYVEAVAAASDRVSYVRYGEEWGGRPLVMAVVTHPEHHANLESLRATHIQSLDPRLRRTYDPARPLIVKMNNAVHGNEPSGASASLYVLYRLAASQEPEVVAYLRGMIVLIDPVLNPHGLDWFANWAENNVGQTPNPNPDHREHEEAWPGGRVNYYGFDLNRDYLMLVNPTSRARLQQFYRWNPHVLMDVHEMGTDATYFFQPGVPTRVNAYTPHENQQLTKRLAAYHAAALNNDRSLYFTAERFDDFYPGKGSTMTDLQGTIGILFEQGSARGHIQESVNGLVTFPTATRHQYLTAFSTLEGSLALKDELLAYQRDFFRDSLDLAQAEDFAGYVIAAPGDPRRLHAFLDLLARHQIGAFALARDRTLDGVTYRAGEAWVVPLAQRQYRYLQAIMEQRTEFPENLFYDITSWTVSLAYGLRVGQLSSLDDEVLGDRWIETTPPPEGRLVVPADAEEVTPYAWVLSWDDHYAPRAAWRFLDAGLRVKAAAEPFSVVVGDEAHPVGAGSLLIPLQGQADRATEMVALIQRAVVEDGVDAYAATTGLTPQGPDLGSSTFTTLEKPELLLVVGEGTDRYSVAALWHHFDAEMRLPVTLVEGFRLHTVDWSRYTTILFPGGSHDLVSHRSVDRLKEWVRNGGTLVLTESSINWARAHELVKATPVVEDEENADDPSTGEAIYQGEAKRRPYADRSDDRALERIRGAIFAVHLDRTHPLAFGFADETLPVFLDDEDFLLPSDDPYQTPLLFADEPLLSGYASEANLGLLSRSAAVTVEEQGGGRVVLAVPALNFRGYWKGSSRVLSNAVFFGDLID